MITPSSRELNMLMQCVTPAVRGFSAGRVMPHSLELPATDPDDSHRGVQELLPLVYAELKRLAYLQMEPERLDHTLTPTALVHEAWVRLADSPTSPQPSNQAHFFTAAAEAMPGRATSVDSRSIAFAPGRHGMCIRVARSHSRHSRWRDRLLYFRRRRGPPPTGR